LPCWLALCALAALAWVVTVNQANGMGIGPGTMGLTLLAFLALWVVMMAAMMLPSVAPMVIVWIRSMSVRATAWQRLNGAVQFLAGYLIVWAAFGLLAYLAFVGSGRLVDASPTAAKWAGAAIFAIAGIYQLTPLKEACLRHCRSPVGSLFHYASFRGPARDLRVGIHHGAYCVACCWGLMIVLIAVGAMNIAVMAALAVVILIEKVWKYGHAFSMVVGGALILAAVLAPWNLWLLPGLHIPTTMGM
jgi:predicted metal-binding membrane protein